MTELVNSDEDKYANESFENDTDEIPEISEVSETESDGENEPVTVPSNSTLYAYARNRFQGRKNSLKNRNYVPYDSSSEDDEDVVISETIVEINTEPMCMDDAVLNSERLPIQPGMFVRRGSSGLAMGRMRLPPKEPLAITEIPNQPSPRVDKDESAEEQVDNDDDNNNNDENEENEENEDYDDNGDNNDANDDEDEDEYDDDVSDNENGTADVVPALKENELLNQFDHLSFIPNEMSEAAIGDGEIVLEGKPSRVLRSKNTIGDGPSATQTNLNNTALADTYQKNVGDFADVDNVSNCPPKGENNELYEYEKEPSIEVRITSETPTSFNTDDYAFHLNFLKQNGSSDKLKTRPQQRKSWSFSNDRMREIERHNHILLRKILSQKPTYHLNTPKPTKFSTLPPTTRVTSAAINRKKKQRQIDLDNQGLKRRIEAISLRRPGQQHLN